MELIILFCVVTSCLQISQILGAVIGGPAGTNVLLAKDTHDPVETTNHIPRMLHSNHNNIPNEIAERAWKTQEVPLPQPIDWRGNACYQPTGHHWQTYGYCEPTVHHWKREVLSQPSVQHNMNALYARRAAEDWNNIAYNNHITQAWKKYVANQPIAQDWTYLYNQPVAEYWKAMYNQPILQNWNGVGTQPIENGPKAGELNQPLVQNWNSNGPSKIELHDKSVKSLGEIKNVNYKKKTITQDEYNHDLGASLKDSAPKLPLVRDRMAENSSGRYVESNMVNADKNQMVEDGWKAAESNQVFVINNKDENSTRASVKTVNVSNPNQSTVGLNDREAVNYQPFANNNMANNLSQTSVNIINENNRAEPLVDLAQKVELSNENVVNNLKKNDAGQPMIRDWKTDYYSKPVISGRNSELVEQDRTGDIANIQDIISSVASSSNYVVTDTPPIDQFSSSQGYNLEKKVVPVKSETLSHNSIGDTTSTHFAAHGTALANNLSGTYASDNTDTVIAASSETLKTVTLPEAYQHLAIGNISGTMALADIVTPLVASNTSKDIIFPDAAATSGTTNISGAKTLAVSNIEEADKMPGAGNIVETVMLPKSTKNVKTRGMVGAKILNDSPGTSANRITSKYVTFKNAPETPDVENVLKSVMPAEIHMDRTSGAILHPKILQDISSPSATVLLNAVKLSDATETPYASNILEDVTLANTSENAAAINISKVVKLVDVTENHSATSTSEASTLSADGKLYHQKLTDYAGTSAPSSISDVLSLGEETPAPNGILEAASLTQVAHNSTEPLTFGDPGKTPLTSDTSHAVTSAKSSEISTDGNASEIVAGSDAHEIPATSNILQIVTIPDNVEVPAPPDVIAIPVASSTLKIEAVPENAKFSTASNTSEVEPILINAEVPASRNTLEVVKVQDDAEIPVTSNTLEIVAIAGNAEVPASSKTSEGVTDLDNAEVHTTTKHMNSMKYLTLPDVSKIPPDDTLGILTIPDNAEILNFTNISDVSTVLYNAERPVELATIPDYNDEIPDENKTWRVVNVPDTFEMSAASSTSEVVIGHGNAEISISNNTPQVVTDPEVTEINANNTSEVVTVHGNTEMPPSRNTLKVVTYTNAAEIPGDGSTLETLTHPDDANAPAARNTLDFAGIGGSPANSKTSDVLTIPDAAEIPVASNSFEVVTRTSAAERHAASNNSKVVTFTDSGEMFAAGSPLKVVEDYDSADIPVANNTPEIVMIPYKSLAANNTSEGMYFSKSAGIHVASNPSELVTFPDINETTIGSNILEESLMFDDIPDTSNRSNISNSEPFVDSNISAASHILEVTSFPDAKEMPATSNTSEVVTFPDDTALHATTNTTDVIMLFDPANNANTKSSILTDSTESDVASNTFEPMMSGIITERLATSNISNTEMFDDTKLPAPNHTFQPRPFAEAAESSAASNTLDVIRIPDGDKTSPTNSISNAVNIAKEAQIPADSYISNDVRFNGGEMTAARSIFNTVNLGVDETSTFQQNRDDHTLSDNSEVPKTGIFNSVNLGDVNPPALQQYSDPLKFTENSGIRNLNINNAVKFGVADTHAEQKTSDPSSLIDGVSNLYVPNDVDVGAAKTHGLQTNSEPIISADRFVNTNQGILNADNIIGAESRTQLDCTEPFPYTEYPESFPKQKTEDTSFVDNSETPNFDISNAVTFDAAYGRLSPRSDSNRFAHANDSTTQVQPFNSDTDYLGRISNIVNFGFGADTRGLRSNTDSGVFGNNPEVSNARILNTVNFHRADIPNYSHILNAVHINSPARTSTSEYGSGAINLDRSSDIPTTDRVSGDFSVNGKGSTMPQISNLVAIGGVASIPSTRTDVASIPSNDETSAGHQITNSVSINNAAQNPFARYISNAVNLAGDISSNQRISNSVTFTEVDQTPSGSHISETVALPNSPNKSFDDILYIPALNNSRMPNTNQLTDNSIVQEDLASQLPNNKHDSHKEEQEIGGNSNQLPEDGVNDEKSTKSGRPLLSLNEPPASSSDTLKYGSTLSVSNTAKSLDVAATPRHSKPIANTNAKYSSITSRARTNPTIGKTKVVTVPRQQNVYFTQLPNTVDTTGRWNYRNQPSNLYQYAGQLQPSTSGTYFTQVCPLCRSRLYGWYPPQ